MREESKQFGEWQIRVRQFGAREGMRVLTRIFNSVGPAIGKAVSAKDDKDTDSSVGEIFNELSAAMDPDTVDYFIGVCAKHSQATQGEKLQNMTDGVMTLCFAGNYMLLFKWLAFCFELNYGSFLEDPDLEEAMANLKGKSSSESPTTSNGTSGE